MRTTTLRRCDASLLELLLLLALLLQLLQQAPSADGFNILDYSHYLDYLPYRQESLVAFEDFRTAPYPPLALRNRKMDLRGLGKRQLSIEEVSEIDTWPQSWPYGPEDFRPLDYQRDEVINTLPQYQYSQSLIEADQVTIFPGLLRVPIRRHFVLPKDKVALTEHLRPYVTPGARVLELFSTYESILPASARTPQAAAAAGLASPGATVGVGWWSREMKANPLLDDWVEQDLSVDPYLPLASNAFDVVVMPANFQLLQRPREMFAEINRVLKPGGTAFVGVKLAMWSFLGWKQGRYYAETNYMEDVLALCSFFHYAGGFAKPLSFDLCLPESNPVGQLKDRLCPQPRLDFYALVQARKRRDSPHGRDAAAPAARTAAAAGLVGAGGVSGDGSSRRTEEGADGAEAGAEAGAEGEDGDGAGAGTVDGLRWAPRVVSGRGPPGEERLGPFY